MSKRKSPVTQDAVNKACTALVDADKTPTVNAVINKIGGSFSTVGAMVTTWKENQASQAAPSIEMPDSIVATMRKATADIWLTASTLAGETIERIRDDANDAVSKAKTELVEYAEEVKRLEMDIINLDDHLESERDTIRQRDTRIAELITANSALKARCDEKTQEIEGLRSDYKNLQAELIAIAKKQAV